MTVMTAHLLTVESVIARLSGSRPPSEPVDAVALGRRVNWPESMIEKARVIDWKPAAVLVPLVRHADQLNVMLTTRAQHLKHHAGQISFPGGGQEALDASPVDTALRETKEEIGVHPSLIKVVGYLDTCLTISGYCVTPVVGVLDSGFDTELDQGEVADIFEVPLSFILNPENRQRHSRELNGHKLDYYVYEFEKWCIWGATAGMLVSLADKLVGTEYVSNS